MITIAAQPLSSRPCIGLGVQADAVIYDDLNRQAGVTDADYLLHEDRLRALRPGNARVFIRISDFNPSYDAATYDWDTVEMARQYRNLETLRDAGAAVHVCMAPFTNAQMMQPGMEATAVALMAHLHARGFDHVRWLSLYNEPDSLYADGSEAFRSYFTDGKARPPWSAYVEKHRRTHDLLGQHGLTERIRLVVPDVVMGPHIRTARLKLAKRDFTDYSVAFSFHHYAAHYPGYYAHPESAFYAPPADEMAGYRTIIGPDAELACWEFNNAGYGMGTFWPGSGPRGEAHLDSMASAVHLAEQVLGMLAAGIDGAALWCLNDVFYTGALADGLMLFGLWRYKWEGWVPRPSFFYYAALIEAFRPGARLHTLAGLPEGLCGLAARSVDGTTVVLLNPGTAACTVTLTPGWRRRLRVAPETLPIRSDTLARPCPEAERPLDTWVTLAESDTLTLAPGELTLLR
jgi:hypothetical protein